MTLLVDTSVWSLVFRRGADPAAPEIQAVRAALGAGESIVATGFNLQELLHCFSGRKARKELLKKFSALPMLVPSRTDHINAADVRNHWQRAGVQMGTIGALIARICIRHDLTLLTADGDFSLPARHCALRVWKLPR